MRTDARVAVPGLVIARENAPLAGGQLDCVLQAASLHIGGVEVIVRKARRRRPAEHLVEPALRPAAVVPDLVLAVSILGHPGSGGVPLHMRRRDVITVIADDIGGAQAFLIGTVAMTVQRLTIQLEHPPNAIGRERIGRPAERACCCLNEL